MLCRCWQVKPLNFRYSEKLYGVRTILESTAIEILCDYEIELPVELEILKEKWCIQPRQYLKDLKTLARQDEEFHCSLGTCS